jgi:hypothetical protein
MIRLILSLFAIINRLFCDRSSLLLEILALRQQLAVLKRRHPRGRLSLIDRLFWVAARRFWSGWKTRLVIVTPETVVCWHRAGFRLYRRWISRVRQHVGRKRISKEVRELIFRMIVEIQPGERRAFMVNYSCSASMFLSERSHDGCAVRPETPSQANAGFLSCAINERQS